MNQKEKNNLAIKLSKQLIEDIEEGIINIDSLTSVIDEEDSIIIEYITFGYKR